MTTLECLKKRITCIVKGTIRFGCKNIEVSLHRDVTMKLGDYPNDNSDLPKLIEECCNDAADSSDDILESKITSGFIQAAFKLESVYKVTVQHSPSRCYEYEIHNDDWVSADGVQ